MFLWFPIHCLCVRSVLSCSLQTTKKTKRYHKHISHEHVYRNNVFTWSVTQILQEPSRNRSNQQPALACKIPHKRLQDIKIVWFGYEFNISMYGAHSNSGHPFLISSDNLHDEVTKRSGRHDTSMAIIRYHMRPSDSDHVVPFPMQITGFYVLFTFLSFPVIFLALSFSPSVLLPLLSLFLPLSVCLCVCVFPCNSL